MKLSIIGGAGVRVPLLVNGLIRRGLPFDDVALFDVDSRRLEVIASLAARRAPGARLTTSASVADCVAGARFVITSIRVGGLASRRHDEAVSVKHGVVGQETVGPAGFAMALRTIPVLAQYTQTIATHAPDAWIINFTNPVGIVTQAMRAAAEVKVIGICDTPTELFAETAHALGVPAQECAFDYIGLNHLGWLREVYRNGQPLLAGIWEDREMLTRVYSRPLFPVEYLAGLRLLPTEYVYYYAFPERATQHMKTSGTSRGAQVSRLTDALFAQLPDAVDPIGLYENYLAERSASYMQIESGLQAPQPPSPWAELTGYDRIAFDVMHAIVNNTNAVIPLNVVNDGNISDLASDDVIEVPCTVSSNGPRPLHVGRLPAAVRDLTVRVKEYERRTIVAARSGARTDLIDALTHNPLVPSAATAAHLLNELALTNDVANRSLE